MSHLTGGRARWAALGAVLGAFAAGGIAYAAIPDAGGVFHACYKTAGGQLRLVQSASACNPNETATQWNQTGPTGPTGPVGISGYEIVRASVMDPPNTETVVQAVCPTGKMVLGGAGSVQGVPTGVWLHTAVTHVGSFSSYDVFAVNTTAATQQINSVAICANVN